MAPIQLTVQRPDFDTIHVALEGSLDLARARGFRAMQFNFVVATNTGAIALWERMGFATLGRLPGAFPSAIAICCRWSSWRSPWRW